jgi:hypothetical protein
MKARRSVEAVAIGKREGGHAELRAALDERFRLRAAVKKTEGAGAMQLDLFVFFRNCRCSATNNGARGGLKCM